MKIYVVNKELSSAHGTTAVVLQFQVVMVYVRPVEMNELILTEPPPPPPPPLIAELTHMRFSTAHVLKSFSISSLR